MSENLPKNDHRALLQNALVALDKMQTKLQMAEQTKHEPLAIVGMGFRFPGGANDMASFWKLLHNGIDAITEVPADRWDMEAYYDPDPDKLGKTYTRWGGFLEQVDHFDPQFFGISPREAASMDPQQRLLLEVTWEALENAGRASPKLAGSRTGVFVGITTHDYANRQVKMDDLSLLDAHFSSGTAHSTAVGRISYMLDLYGPNIALDTACSSSLVATHLACQSLRVGESDMALVGGVNLMLLPDGNVATSRARMMSFDGRCKTFDARADGYVRSEGCAMVVLKRLSDAQRDGDNIMAVILGSAVNQDGRSNGLTAPNGKAQEAVIQAALADARVQPSDVSYVETHGTGTSLGDPIEVRALGATYGQGHSQDDPLMIGSVKTNVGHLEAAAGIVGLVKVVLALQNKTIPPHLHLQEPNPYIPWESIPITIPTTPTPWQMPDDKRRIAGLSSFGFSGTNSHMIIAEAPMQEMKPLKVERTYHVLALAAKNRAALEEMAQRYEMYLQQNPSVSLADVAFTANTGRSHYNERLVLVAQSTAQVQEQLAAWQQSKEPRGLLTGTVPIGDAPEVVFLFTGQGAQYPGMARQLYETQPTFRKVLEKCDELLQSYSNLFAERPLLSVIYPDDEADENMINQTAYTQPALFAIEYALAQLWRSWGVEPSIVLGHSVGEYVAACLAGVFSLEDGLKLIAARGRLMQALPAGGAMAAVFTDEKRVQAAISPYEDEVSIAAINGPSNVVISGAGTAVSAILDTLTADGIKSRPLTVSHAFHSPLMEPMLDEFQKAAASITYNSPQIGVISNVTGQLVTDDSIANAAYWRQHVRQAVRFADAMQVLHEEGYRFFLEVGPSPTLLGMGQRCWPAETEGVWLPSLRSGREDWQQMLESLGQLYVHGLDVDWDSFERDYKGRQRLQLPTYPFQRARYWLDFAEQPSSTIVLNGGSPLHLLLGRRLPSALPIFQAELNASSQPYLADHQIHDVVLLPATAYVEMVLAAAQSALGDGTYELEDVVIHEALPLSESRTRTVQTILMPQETGATFQLFSQAEGDPGKTMESANSWRLHATGKIVANHLKDVPEPVSVEALQARLTEKMSVEKYYNHLALVGADYGPAFRGLQEIWRQNGEALGYAALPPSLEESAASYRIHPALLDACLQLTGAAVPGAADMDSEENNIVYVPVGLQHVRFYGQGGTAVWCQVQIRSDESGGQETLVGDLTLFSEIGQTIAAITGLRLQRVTRQALQRAVQVRFDDWLYEVDWPRQPRDEAQVTWEGSGHWLIFADETGLGAELAAHLEAQGETYDLVYASDAFSMGNARRWHLDPLQTKDFEQLLAEVMAAAERPLRGVIHLWSVSESFTDDTDIASLQAMQARNCGSILYLVQTLTALQDVSPRLWLVTRGAQPVGETVVNAAQSPLWGLGNVITLEQPELNCVRVDLDPVEAEASSLLLFDEIWKPDGEDQIALRGNVRHVARLMRRQARSRMQKQSQQPQVLEITERGVLDNLALKPMKRQQPGPREIEIEVYATGLNFRDVLNALGMYPGDAGPLGSECAGKVVAVGDDVADLHIGDEVMALAPRSFSNYVTIPAVLAVPKPSSLSFAEAATIPITFLTADYALNRLVKMKADDRILIHAATGGVGMAAIQLAQRARAEIFGTAGSLEKRELLKSLGVPHVMHSRTLDFADEIMAITDGKGVDIVLNSLAGDFIPKSVSVLSENGRFVEIGKTDIWDEAKAKEMKPGIEYFVLYLGEVIDTNPELIREMMLDLMADFEAGVLKPLPQQVFPVEKAAEAFRFMAQAKHVGKIVITQEHEDVDSRPTASPQADATYLITGGMGGLGLVFARWLIDQGARHLVLMGRSEPSEQVRQVLGELRELGVQVEVAQVDVSQQAQVAEMLAHIEETMPPLRGVIHAAGVLADGMLQQQSWPQFAKVMAPKVEGTWNLHQLTLDKSLDFFVLFSAGAALLGSPGQSNYAAANAFLDALAHSRQAQGLPALSIDWGAWAEVGMAAALGEQRIRRWSTYGMGLITPEQGSLILDALLQQNSVQVGVLPVNWAKYGQQFAKGEERPFLQRLISNSEAISPTQKEVATAPQLLLQLEDASTPEEYYELLLDHVQEQVVVVLGLDPNQPTDPLQGLTDIGMDSLMAVELSNRLQRNVEQSLPSTLAFEYPTISALANYLMTEIIPMKNSLEAPIDNQEVSDDQDVKLAELDQLSEAEVEDSLLKELQEAGY